MDTIEQITKTLFEEVKQEIGWQMESIKSEIDDNFAVFVPTSSDEEIKNFVEAQKQYYEDWFSDEFGKPRVMPFTWQRYHKLVSDNLKIDETREEILDPSRRREVVLRHTRIFLFAQIIHYLHSLQFEEKTVPLFEQGHHKITLRYQQLDRRKNIKPTELDKRESATLYELLADLKWVLGLNTRPKTNVAACIALYSGFSVEELKKEIDLVTEEDKTDLKRKLIKILHESLPPDK